MHTEPSMAVEFQFECQLPNGLHARPSGCLAEVANRFTSNCELTNLRNGATADLKGVLSTIAACVRRGDPCRLRVEGEDGSTAADALRRFIAEDLAGCDGPLPWVAHEGTAPSLPRGLESAGGLCLAGFPASGGVGQGKALALGRLALSADFAAASEDAGAEQARVARGLARVHSRLEVLLGRHPAETESAILRAHLAIVGNAALARELAERVDSGRSAAQAVVEAGEHFRRLLDRSGDGYIGERAVDVEELFAVLLEEMYGARFQPAVVDLEEPTVAIAEMLAPHQLLALGRRWLKGIVLESAGATSHAVILARSMGVPAVVGAAGSTRRIVAGAEVIVDGDRGLVFPHPTEEVRRFYGRERASRRRAPASDREAARLAISADGERLEIGANVASAEEAAAAFAQGAGGIGLFRTEMLFAGRNHPPSEEDQFSAYAAAVRAAAGRPVILRTADFGGDKPLPYLPLPEDRQRSLGRRGIRLYREHGAWIRTQLRAALRASALGPVWLMAPMIASVEEARWLRREIESAGEELRAEGREADRKMPLGAMIEVPAAAYVLEGLCAELDFFSIGTNDLSQYFFAADRENPRLAELANVRTPAFLALLNAIVREIRGRGKWVGLCGEMAADVRNLPLLLGLGLNEISACASSIPALERELGRLHAADCRELLARALECRTAEEVEGLLDSGAPGAQPLLASALVALRSDSRNKEEAIRELALALHAAGRIRDAAQMEAAVWARELAYSTGLGYGFAVPHCKSDVVRVNSIGILKLDWPIEWGSLDGAPVRMVILLAMRESEQNDLHMQVFSRLARKLMDEEFRARLMRIEDAREMVAQVGRELEVDL